MKNYILLNSVSSALKGKDILDKNNIRSSVERTPKNNVARSCGYSLMVMDEIERAKEILENNKVIVLGIVTR
ncbi:MAG: DUF3343 domain-containing protein [Ruminococcus sp.]